MAAVDGKSDEGKTCAQRNDELYTGFIEYHSSGNSGLCGQQACTE
jgi:hypothetical protein